MLHLKVCRGRTNTFCFVQYSDVIMGAMSSQITSLTIVYSAVSHQRKHQSSASLAFVREIHRLPVNSPHKVPGSGKMFPFDDVIMGLLEWMWSKWFINTLLYIHIQSFWHLTSYYGDTGVEDSTQTPQQTWQNMPSTSKKGMKFKI